MITPTPQQYDNSAQGNETKAKADMPDTGDQAKRSQPASNDDAEAKDGSQQSKDGSQQSKDGQQQDNGGG